MGRYLKALALVAAVPAAGLTHAAAQPPPASKIVRLFAVRTEFDSGLLDGLLADFQAKTGFQVRHITGKDTYEQARAGNVDVMLSHYRHDGLGAFVSQGYGLWPEPVMANISAFLAPPGDPAHIKGLTDGIEMFRRIAAAKAPFVVNGDANTRYLLATLWNAAGRPDKQGWYIDAKVEGLAAAQHAVAQHAYTIWGVTAFIQAKQGNDLPLDLVIPTDSLMQRIMVCVVSNPAKLPRYQRGGRQGAADLSAVARDPGAHRRLPLRRDRYAGVPAGRPQQRKRRAGGGDQIAGLMGFALLNPSYAFTEARTCRMG